MLLVRQLVHLICKHHLSSSCSFHADERIYTHGKTFPKSFLQIVATPVLHGVLQSQYHEYICNNMREADACSIMATVRKRVMQVPIAIC